MKKFWKLKLCLILVPALLCPRSFAQDSTSQDKDKTPFEAKEAVGTILVAGLIGGILGLSTLSFYSQPQNNIRNITFGAGAGMIASIIYLVTSAATTPIAVDSDKPQSAYYVVPSYGDGRFILAGGLRF